MTASPEFLTAATLPARHAFFTRRGGVSQGVYSSLNASLSGGDDPAHVAANRACMAGTLGVSADRLVGVTQVHGVSVAIVSEPWAPGKGPQADALVTDVPGLALGVVTADCAPVLFATGAGSAACVAATHAGWRGAVAGVLEATVLAMESLGARRDALMAAVGPCIGPASYEVGEEVHAAVLAAGPFGAAFLQPGRRPGHWQFDLPGYCAARLEAAGVHTENLAESLGVDTCADEARFFSHRRRTLAGGGAIGHQLSAIVLERAV